MIKSNGCIDIKKDEFGAKCATVKGFVLYVECVDGNIYYRKMSTEAEAESFKVDLDSIYPDNWQITFPEKFISSPRPAGKSTAVKLTAEAKVIQEFTEFLCDNGFAIKRKTSKVACGSMVQQQIIRDFIEGRTK